MNHSQQKQDKVIFVDKKSAASVCCPPKEQQFWNKHPRVYLAVAEKGEVTCPYCGNIFRLKDH